MPARIPLPDGLDAAPFTTRDARERGVSADRLRSVALQRSYRGVRSVGLDLDALGDRCRAYMARIPDDHVLSHDTAARLWGLPVPLYAGDALHVSAPRGRRAPQVRGVVGHQVAFTAEEWVERDGLRLVTPELAWSQLATRIRRDDLVACGDHAVTARPHRGEDAVSSLEALAGAVERRRGYPGNSARRSALGLVRVGSWSRPETLARLLLTRCGLPEPVPNAAMGGFTVDLAWPQFGVAFEYQGDHHRSTEQFRWDLERLELLRERRVLVAQATADDLFRRPVVLVRRVERCLRERGWSGSADLRLAGHFRP